MRLFSEIFMASETEVSINTHNLMALKCINYDLKLENIEFTVELELENKSNVYILFFMSIN